MPSHRPAHDAMDDLEQYREEEETREKHEGERETKEEEEEEEEPKKEQGGGKEDDEQEKETEKVQKLKPERDDFDEEEESDDSFDDKDEYMLVKLDGVRKEVQCPICLGIIRKTRTVMECLHRFCRECIDKSMRLGNNECPACRTHCASRRSLRDDPNYDTLISVLYPDIDKFEQQELAFNEEEKNRNKIIQETIAETFRRQSECLGKRAAPKSNPVRRSRKRSRRDPGSGSSEEEQQQNETNNNNEENNTIPNGPRSPESLSPPPPPPTRKRGRPRSNHHADVSNNNNNNINNNNVNNNNNNNNNLRDNLNVSPIRAWGKNGTRTRHLNNNNSNINNNNLGGSNSRVSRASRLGRLVEYLRGLDGNNDKNNNEVEDLNVSLVKKDGEEGFYLRCRSSVSVDQLCKVVSERVNREAEKVEIFAEKKNIKFNGETSLQKIVSSFSLNPTTNLELVYEVKAGNEEGACE